MSAGHSLEAWMPNSLKSPRTVCALVRSFAAFTAALSISSVTSAVCSGLGGSGSCDGSLSAAFGALGVAFGDFCAAVSWHVVLSPPIRAASSGVTPISMLILIGSI